MSLNNTHVETIIPTMEITTFHTDEEPKVHIENYFDIVALKKKVGTGTDEGRHGGHARANDHNDGSHD